MFRHPAALGPAEAFASNAFTAPATIAIVGNAPETGDPSGAIDRAEWVVRFNNAHGFGGATGRRVTHLALVNHGGQMREWLSDPRFAARPHVARAERIVFPFARKPGRPADNDEDGRDWTEEAIARLDPEGRRVEILPPQVHRAAGAILSHVGHKRYAPSTGFLVALALLFRFGGRAAIDVYGFGFAGWDFHDWAREQRWFEAMAAEGMLRLHPVEGRAAA